MSWRNIVITGVAKLDYKMNYLVVRKHEETTNVLLDEIGMIIIESTMVSLTTTLLSNLMKNKIKVIFCDEKHNPESELIPYFGSYDTSIKVREQSGWTENSKKIIWTEIVTEKIRNQSRFLREMRLEDRADLILSYAREVQLGDSTNREGHAAKVYFNTLFGLDFTRNKKCPVNAALDYGYSILLSTFNKEIISNGYITQIGIFHDNQFNQFNLSSDLMEPFRICVDRKVVALMPDKFEKEEKFNMLSILNDEVIIDEKINTVSNAIKIYCKSVFEAIKKEEADLIKFYYYEL